MKTLRFILTGIAVLFLSLIAKAELITTVSSHSIQVESTKQGVKGYKGCEQNKLTEIPAFTFDLFKKGGNPNQTCTYNNSGSWQKVSSTVSEDGKAIFNNLAEGNYKVICYSGHAIGCLIEGAVGAYPNRSIVLEKESSSIIQINYENNLPELSTLKSSDDQLKVFPNPAQDEITIQLTNKEMSKQVNISLMDLLGQSLLTQNHPIENQSGFYEWTIQLADFPPGAYFIRLVDADGISLQKKILIHRNQ